MTKQEQARDMYIRLSNVRLEIERQMINGKAYNEQRCMEILEDIDRAIMEAKKEM